MNLWRYVCDHARGMVKGEQFYRQTVDAGKAIAPVAAPVVEAILTKAGLPVTPGAALSVLAGKAASASALPIPDADALRGFIAQSLVKQKGQLHD